MKKIKHIFLLILIMLIMPVGVNADDTLSITFDEKIKTYGSVTKVTSDWNTDSINPGVMYFYDINNSSTKVEFKIVMRADIGKDISSFSFYFLDKDDKVIFTQPKITTDSDGTSLVKKNDGEIVLYFSITNNEVKKIKISAESSSRGNATKNVQSFDETYPVEFFSSTLGNCQSTNNKKWSKVIINAPTAYFSNKTNMNGGAKGVVTIKNLKPSTGSYQFTAILEANSGNKVVKVAYWLYKGNEKLCGSFIQGSGIRNKNKGHIELDFTIGDKNITAVKLQLYSGSSSDGTYPKSLIEGKVETVKLDWGAVDTIKQNENNALGTKVDGTKLAISNNATNCAAFTLGSSNAGTTGSGGKVTLNIDSAEKANFEVQAADNKTVDKVTVEFKDESDNIICWGDISGTDMKKASVKFDVKFLNTAAKQFRVTYGSKSSGWKKIDDKNAVEELIDDIEDATDTSGADISIQTPGFNSGLSGLEPTDGLDICDKEDENSLASLIDEYWGYVMVTAPILLIVMLIIDFLKAVTGNDADMLKKSSNNAIKRVVATVILLMTPVIVSVVFNLMGIGHHICF